jgi:hypothetical protein
MHRRQTGVGTSLERRATRPMGAETAGAGGVLGLLAEPLNLNER